MKEEKDKKPSIVDGIKAATNAILKKGAEIIFSEEKHGIESLSEMRIKTCERCVHFDAKERRCNACGCFMDVKVHLATNKTAQGNVEITHCPNGLWQDVHITNLYREQKGQPKLFVFTQK